MMNDVIVYARQFVVSLMLLCRSSSLPINQHQGNYELFYLYDHYDDVIHH